MASTAAKEVKISLKILVNVKAKKVVFAEAGKDFVDFIFCIMSLPLSSVTKLLNEKLGMVGCLGTLYKTIECLDGQYYEPNLNKDSVLKPRASLVVPLLSLIDAPSSELKLYRCSSHSDIYSDCRGMICPKCRDGIRNKITSEFLSYNIVSPRMDCYSTAGFVKRAVSYMVMDNLEVKPTSVTLIRSLVKDIETLEEKQVEFGLQEGLTLLKASLEKRDVLTTVFFAKKI